MKEIQTTCSFCATGCNLIFSVDNNKITSCTPAIEYPVNKGLACIKGRNLTFTNSMQYRVTTPLMRDEQGIMQPITWEKAYQVIAEKFGEINEKYGRGSLAFLSTGQIPTEEMALLGLVGRFGMGMEGDGNTRLCMATAVVSYNQSLGFDSPPYTWEDLMETELAIFIGANPAENHPVPWWRARRENPKLETVVIDPRECATAKQATKWLPIKPKGDMFFLYTLANILIEKNYIDEKFIEEHTDNFQEFKKFVSAYKLENVEKDSGLTSQDVLELAERIHSKSKVSFWWTMGVNQSYEAVRTAEAIINLSLMIGAIGKAGTGPNSITGQCNAMGSRLYSVETCLYAGRKFNVPEDRKLVSEILGVDDSLIPTRGTIPYDEIVKGIGEKKIRGLWVVATNPVVTIPHNEVLEELNSKIDFLVVQDIYYDTETAKQAHIFLPASTSLEKEGTFINTERRFGAVQQVVPPPEGIKTDYEIIWNVGKALGLEEKLSLDRWKTPKDAFNLLRAISKGMPCEFTGMDYDALKGSHGIQWPFKSGDILKDDNRRLFEDEVFYNSDKKGNFLFQNVESYPEVPDTQYPYILMTGRGGVGLWHTLTRTRNIPTIEHMYPLDSHVHINAADAEKLGVKEEDIVTVTSKNGTADLKIKIDDALQEMQVFIPMHHPEANRLTDPLFDPYSKQPSYKYATVSIVKRMVK